MRYGIFYNEKHSYKDFDLIILNNRSIQTPSKVKIKASVPYLNGDYDFSNLYGSNVYSDRILEYTFLFKAKDNKDLQYKRMSVENWLLHPRTKGKLIDDDLEGFYYNAECEETAFEDLGNVGKLTAKFVAYPFKISEEYEGSDVWDTFNFEMDVLQETSFKIDGEATIKIYNLNIVHLNPTIKATSDLEITKVDGTFSIKEGETNDYKFKLYRGANEMRIKGTGTIDFLFRKEVL